MNHLHLEAAKTIIDQTTTVFWFRRDLRLRDNRGLLHALRDGGNVAPLFIFDTDILSKLEDRADRRVDFIYCSLQQLANELEAFGTALLILHGKPSKIFEALNPASVYANHDYEPYARQRDALVSRILKNNGCAFHTFKDQVIFEKDEIVKDDGTPYTVFTPYSRKWKRALKKADIDVCDSYAYRHRFAKLDALPLPALETIGFTKTAARFPDARIRTEIIEHYARHRDYPALAGTSRLSVHLRFGTISIRQAARAAKVHESTWLSELIWREFYHMILWHYPHIETSAFKRAYDYIEWRNDAEGFEKWCEGRTGYPMVDAGMRELNATGFMHNRLRMITASFLSKHLLIDYRWGEAYFAKKLLDFDLAANNGGWQWAAGSGCDAVPYFRIFNPALQQKKFDNEGTYVKKWVPEAYTPAYPSPIVEHNFARERALRVYRTSLEGQKQISRTT